jgi:hypothetical protein
MISTVDKLSKRTTINSDRDYVVLHINNLGIAGDTNYKISIKDFLQGVTLTPPAATVSWGDIIGDIANQLDLLAYIQTAVLNAVVPTTQIQADFAQTNFLAIDYVKNKQQEFNLVTQTTFNYNHNLDRYVQVICINDSDSVIGFPEIKQPNKNTVEVTFSVPFTGKIVLS